MQKNFIEVRDLVKTYKTPAGDFTAVLIWLGLIVIIASLVPAQNVARLTIRDTLVYE